MLAKAAQITALLRSARETYGSSWIAILRRFFNLYFLRNFSITEIGLLALLDQAISDEHLARYISKDNCYRAVMRLAAVPQRIELVDKVRFEDHCIQSDLSVTRTLLKIEKPHSDEDLRSTQSSLVDFLSRKAPKQFVVKPSRGGAGSGLEFFTKSDSGFTTEDKSVVDTEGLARRLINRADKEEKVRRQEGLVSQVLLLQQMLKPHPQMVSLTGTSALQCVRVCTYVDKEEDAYIVFAFLKIIVGDNLIDNFGDGSNGNLIGEVDYQTGEIVRCFGRAGSSPCSATFDVHPHTQSMLQGFQIPDWQHVIELALAASNSFAPLPLVGWDVALTEDGPVLIEGNINWSPVVPFLRIPPPLTKAYKQTT